MSCVLTKRVVKERNRICAIASHDQLRPIHVDRTAVDTDRPVLVASARGGFRQKFAVIVRDKKVVSPKTMGRVVGCPVSRFYPGIFYHQKIRRVRMPVKQGSVPVKPYAGNVLQPEVDYG